MSSAPARMPVSMLTTEISEVTGKRHEHVMRDARSMLEELHDDDAPKFGAIYPHPNGERVCSDLSRPAASRR
ncbi:hypothetical protein GCM10007884_42530 [Methylobacterium brachythecii]|uniref:Rha family transcriptional regulator n=1 Tax=Methylobacterium brachythecii TaxID=1176177 RepID=A0ABQ6D8A2_9HYPH|nr:hypothetical protein GCM10007884_42530 [Methylobacterium brachythecii]